MLFLFRVFAFSCFRDELIFFVFGMSGLGIVRGSGTFLTSARVSEALPACFPSSGRYQK